MLAVKQILAYTFVNAVFEMDTLNGKEYNRQWMRKKNPNAVAMGKKGGAARARKLSPERRREIAQKGAAARWNSTLSRADGFTPPLQFR
jgi:hypothetical protein